MTGIETQEELNRLCIPLVRQGHHFVEAPEAFTIEADPALQRELLSDIEERFLPYQAEVEVGGQLYRAMVFAPPEGDDYHYVMTDEARVPLTATRRGEESKVAEPVEGTDRGIRDYEVVNDYLDYVREAVTTTDALAPDLRLSLVSQFVRPDLRMIRTSETTHQPTKVSWERLLRVGRLVVLGSPGMGKTSLLRRLTLEFLGQAEKHRYPPAIPVYVQLRDLGDQDFNLLSLQRYLSRIGGNLLAEALASAAESHKFVLLCDGLDEVPLSRRESAVATLQEFSLRFPHLRLIVSMRTSAYRWELPDFTHVELQPFSHSQVKEWSCQVIHPRKSWKLFASHLDNEPDLWELLSNPLMLSVAVQLYTRYSITPIDRTRLLQRCVETLVKDWDAVRGVSRAVERWAEPQHATITLSRAAYHSTLAQQVWFSAAEFGEWRTRWQESTEPSWELTVLAENTGLVETTGSGTWAFVHDALRAYLTAAFVVVSSRDAKEFLAGKLAHRHWQTVCSYACALAEDASSISRFVMDTRELQRTERASLLAEILAQDVFIDPAIVHQSCYVITDALEKIFGTEYDLMEESSHDLPARPWKSLWSMALVARSRGRAETKPLNETVKRLVQAVYKARSGPARDLLRSRMRESNVASVRAFARSLDIEGVFADELMQTNRGQELVVSINPQSPEVQVD